MDPSAPRPESHTGTDAPVYTVSIYLAAPGTVIRHPSQPDHRSVAGHAYYSISNGSEEVGYGFSPIETGIRGPGRVVLNEKDTYQNPTYIRTLEISEQQYRMFKEFGDRSLKKDETYFNLYYNGVNNSCIDFVWTGLNRAGLHPRLEFSLPGNQQAEIPLNSFDGTLKVLDNKDMIRSIPAPYPDSPYNSEFSRPLPKDRDWKQKMLTENELPPTSPELQRHAYSTSRGADDPFLSQRRGPGIQSPDRAFSTGDADLDRLAAALFADNDAAISQLSTHIARSPEVQAFEQWGREQLAAQQQEECQQQELTRQQQGPVMRL